MAADYGKAITEAVKSLNKTLGPDKVEKLGIGFLEAEVKAIATGLSSGNRYKMIRELMVGVTAAIPVGGAFISSVLNIVMADQDKNPVEELKKKMAQIKDEITKETNEKIIHHIESHFNTLHEKLMTFENSVNGKTESYYTSIQKVNGQVAREINDKFKELINECTNKKMQIELLPLYTTVASSHLIFLQFIEQNKQGNPRLSIDSKVYETYLRKDVNESRNKYIQYIQETYQKNSKLISEKMEQIAKDNGVTYTLDYQDILNKISNKKAEIEKQNAANLEMSRNMGGSGISAKQIDTTQITQDEKDAKVIVSDKNQYYMGTVANPAFTQAAKWGLVQDTNGKMYFYDIDGQKQTGLEKIGDKAYYFHPEMVTGWIYLDHRYQWYYFSPEENFKNSSGATFNKGEMVIGLIEDNKHWFYLTPAEFQKNYSGFSYSKGQMMTGWVQLSGESYYFSPENNNKNDEGEIFNKGAMMTGWVQWENSWYYLNKELKHVPIGSMLHDVIAMVKNKEGKYVEHKFGEDGKMKW
ncbi:insecticidal delta-endotoxin Cry8Ea1 family protein [Bacillus cereus]|nr:insecticidal delta-endotoxin Cry8Ea1 family protein [Bacillus cereus]